MDFQTKLNETKRELKEWLNNPNSKEDLTLYGKDRIQEKLKENILPKSILNGFESLTRWYKNNFVYEMLTSEQSNFRQEMTVNGYHILILADKFGDIYEKRNPPYFLFDKVAFWLANTFILNWTNRSKELTDLINKNLFTDVLEGGLDFKPSSWFILDIINQTYDKTLQKSELNYPKDMGVYQTALDYWDTKDLGQLDSIVSSLCDFHLENATYGEDQENTFDIQFSNLSWFVYAFEILTWLRAREIMGLNNPEKFTHPLMQLAINQLPKNPISVVDDELFLQALEKLDT